MLSDFTKPELIEKILDMSERLDKLSLVVAKDNDKITQQQALIDELVGALNDTIPVLCTFQASLRGGKKTIMERIANLKELIAKAEGSI